MTYSQPPPDQGDETAAQETGQSEVQREPEAMVYEVPVQVERSVRYNRLLLVGTVIGAVLGALVATLFPVVPEAHYDLWQIAGFCAVIGGAAGLLLGGVTGLILARVAKHKRGGAVAHQTDVR